MKIKTKFKRLWVYFFISKIIYMFSAIFVYSQFSPLVDTHSYLTGAVYEPRWMFTESTSMIGTIAYFFSLILGPVLAPITKIKKNYRCRILIRYPKKLFIQKYLAQSLKKLKVLSGIKLEVDVDPINFS